MAAVKSNAEPLPYTGVGLAGGEFIDPVKTPDPVHGKNWVYPTADDFHYFFSKGRNVFRLPFLWETIQPGPKKPFRPEEIKRLQDAVALATSQGTTALLDPHDYAGIRGPLTKRNTLGSSALSVKSGRPCLSDDSFCLTSPFCYPATRPTGGRVRL